MEKNFVSHWSSTCRVKVPCSFRWVDYVNSLLMHVISLVKCICYFLTIMLHERQCFSFLYILLSVPLRKENFCFKNFCMACNYWRNGILWKKFLCMLLGNTNSVILFALDLVNNSSQEDMQTTLTVLFKSSLLFYLTGRTWRVIPI